MLEELLTDFIETSRRTSSSDDPSIWELGMMGECGEIIEERGLIGLPATELAIIAMELGCE